MNGLRRVVGIAAMATIGPVASGDDTKSSALAGSNPAIVDNTTAMVDTTGG